MGLLGGTLGRACLIGWLSFGALGAGGCATYIDRISNASAAASGGDYPGAVSVLNALLEVSSADALPARWSGDRALAALDRGVLQQAAGRYDAAARDLSAAEQQLELLDLSTNAISALASYLYSDSVRTYKTPPVERLALNAINLQNYLARGDLAGAAVEARRFQVTREYLTSIGVHTAAPDRLGSFLAGFVFEHAAEGDRALRYYDEVLAGGALGSLVAPVTRLARRWPYRTARLSEVLSAGKRDARSDALVQSELLIVVNVGRVPHKVPERIAVGAAIGIGGAYVEGDLDVLRYSASKVLVYPELVPTPSTLGAPWVRLNGNSVVLEGLADLGGSIRREYEAAKPRILAAALTRMAARAAVAEGVRASGNDESQAVGDLLSILFESALVALDRPDTRSWTMLPERVLVARVPVVPGRQTVEVGFGGSLGAERTVVVDVREQGWAAVVVTEPR